LFSRLKTKVIAAFLSLIMLTSFAVILLGYYSVPPSLLPDSRIVRLEWENLDVVILHFRQYGYFENYIRRIVVEGVSYKIYNSTHLVSDRGDYLKYLATGKVSVAERLLYGVTFIIYGREEPLDGHIIFWGKILLEHDSPPKTVTVSLERAVLFFPSVHLPFEVNVEYIQNLSLSEHPHIFYSKEEVPALRSMICNEKSNPMNVSFPKIFSYLKEMADSFLTESYFSVYNGAMYIYLPPNQPRRHPDNFPYWTGISRELQARLETLSLIYLITGEKRYAERAKSFMLYISTWNQWTDPDYKCAGPRTCLDIGHISMGMAIAYDWIYDSLDAAEKFIIREALISKGIIPAYTEALEENSWLQNPMIWPNGYAIVISGLGMASLTLLGEDPRAETWLNTAINYIVRWMDKMGADGGYTEGHTYASYATDFTSRFLYALLKYRGVNLFNHSYMKNIPYFVIYSAAPDGKSIVNFEDSSLDAIYSWKETMAMAASLNNNRYAQWFLNLTGVYNRIIRSHTYNGIYHFIGFNPNIEPLNPEGSLPTSRLFASIGWAIFRTGWKSTDVLFAFKCGPWGSHHHLDAADFILNYQGVWFAAAPGYRLSTSTEAHNTLLIDGKGQVSGDCQLTGFFNSSFIDYVCGDASRAYPIEGLSFVRQVIFIKPNLFLIFDEVKASKSISISWIMHSETGSSIDISGSKCTIKRNERTMIVNVASPQRFSSSRGSTEDLPYIRFDIEPSNNIIFLASLNPTSKKEEESSISSLFYGDYTQIDFTSLEGSGLAVISKKIGYMLTLQNISSDASIFGLIRGKKNEIKYFILNGSLLLGEGTSTVIRFSKRGFGAVKISVSEVSCEIHLNETNDVSIYSPRKPLSVYEVGGAEIPYKYDDAQKTVTVTLKPGYHVITIKL